MSEQNVFPMWRYRASADGIEARLFCNEAELAVAGEGWFDSPKRAVAKVVGDALIVETWLPEETIVAPGGAPVLMTAENARRIAEGRIPLMTPTQSIAAPDVGTPTLTEVPQSTPPLVDANSTNGERESDDQTGDAAASKPVARIAGRRGRKPRA